MLEAGATQEEIREMKANQLQEWGIDAPQWSGSHSGETGDLTDNSYVTALEAVSSTMDAEVEMEAETVAATATNGGLSKLR